MAKDSTGLDYSTKDGKPPSAPNLPVSTPYGSGVLVGNTVVLDKKPS
jgi:hypothetical protein